jgi:uncharacterized protein
LIKLRKILFIFIIVLIHTSCSHVFFQPDRLFYTNPKVYNLEYKNIFFKSKDGTKLHAWYFESPKKIKKGTIIQFHGNAQNLTSHYSSLAWLVHEGYDLFTFDYRGYGSSGGEASMVGANVDSLVALNKAYELHIKKYKKISGQSKFIMIGQSLGGAIAAHVYHDFKYKKDVSLIVLDSTFASYQDIAFRKLQKHWLTYLISPLSYLLVTDKYAPNKKYKLINVPVLIIHDLHDPVVEFENAQDVYNELKHNQRLSFWKTKQGKHISFFFDNRMFNRNKFLSYLSTLK